MSKPVAEPELVADCSRCFALCCVLLPYRRDAGFGADKPGGVPCHHLASDDRCGIHADLRERGWSGCAIFDCFGAGQHVSQVTYGGTLRGASTTTSARWPRCSPSVRRVHELLAHLGEVGRRSPDETSAGLRDRLLELRDGTPVELLTADLDELHEQASALLGAASARIRGRPHPTWHARTWPDGTCEAATCGTPHCVAHC